MPLGFGYRGAGVILVFKNASFLTYTVAFKKSLVLMLVFYPADFYCSIVSDDCFI
jgi:hypothetical protein